MAKVLTAAAALALLIFAVPVGSFAKTELTEARVTRIIREVLLLPEQAAPHPAALQDMVRGGTAIRTGVDSRTELTFPDQTLARLGANTVFSFSGGTRALDLGGGAMLLQVPKGAGGAKILTAAVTAAITGTTVLIEYHPPKGARDGKDFSSRNPGGNNVAFGFVTSDSVPADLSTNYIKFITLEGVARIYVKDRPGEPILVPAGKMLIISPDGSSYELLEVNLEVLVNTSPLITDFSPLPSYPLIVDEIQRQREKEIAGELIDTNLVDYGGGQPVTLRDPSLLDTLDQRFSATAVTPTATPSVTPSPSATPSKFGTPPVITSVNAYVVSSGTRITTDPAITSNGVTDFGKVYRSASADGSFTTWAFGSSSNFDMLTGLDQNLATGSNLPVATFKFSALQLAGDPSIDTTGGATTLALISVGNLSDSAPGGPLTFAGINTLLLATQNGAINLGANISFSNLNRLIFYARGFGANLTLSCPINGVQSVDLDAEGSVQVNGGQTVNTFRSIAGIDFLTGTGKITAPNVFIQANNDVNLALSRFAVDPSVVTSVSLQAGANVNVDASGDQSLFANASSLTINGTGINFSGTSTGEPIMIQFRNSAVVSFLAGANGINAPTIDLIHPGSGLSLSASGNIAFDSIQGADMVQSTGGDISCNLNLIANTIVANGTVSANHVEAQNVTALGNLVVGPGAITPFLSPVGANLLHTFMVATVISPNGIDFNGNQFPTASSPGGILEIDALSQVFGAGGIGSVNFNGGDFGGDGGTLTVNTVGDLSLAGTTITATTGQLQSAADPPTGAGGKVNLTSTSGQVSINGAIQVSSSDVGIPNGRSSARGGNINIRSDATTGVAVNITDSGQLLALLDNAAPGPGGLITIRATGATSSINAGGQMRADRGGIDIRHTGTAGAVNLNNPTLQADIIKAAALGPNGTLQISGGTLNANSVLKLYAPGSNGQIIFLANCTLQGGSMSIIAANTVTIANSVIVTTNGRAASVFTNTANYSGFGGNGTTSGTFGGLGALNPQPLSSAPPLGNPGAP
jgi:hypothetical protein